MLRRSLWLAGVTLLTVGGALAQDKKSVWAGVYDAKQAARGAELYTRACAACHGPDLEGIEQAPPLAGGTFAQRWDGTALKKLLERLEEMPPDDPNKRLSDQQNVDVLAFLLSANKIPAGTVPLDADRNGLAQITFLATKPKIAFQNAAARVAPDGAAPLGAQATPVTRALRRAPSGAVRRQDPRRQHFETGSK